MNGLRCPKCSRLVRDGWQVDWATGISDGIECGCGAILEVAAYVVGALLSITLAVAAAVWMVENDVLADLELRERVGTLASKIKFDTNGKPVRLDASEADLDWLYESLPHETAWRVLDVQGNVALVSEAGETFWPSGGSAPRLERDTYVFKHNGMTLHGATESFEYQGQQWIVQFATSERLMKLIQHKFALPYMGIGIGIFSAVLIVAFGLCAYITLRYALKPLRGISEAAAAISPRAAASALAAACPALCVLEGLPKFSPSSGSMAARARKVPYTAALDPVTLPGCLSIHPTATCAAAPITPERKKM